MRAQTFNEQVLFERQVSLEAEMVGLGVDRYYYAKGEEKDLDLRLSGKRMISAYLDDIEDGIIAFIEEAKAGKASKLATTVNFLTTFDTRLLAYVTARQCVNSFGRNNTITVTSKAIVNSLMDHLEYVDFQEQNPALFATLVRDLKRTSNGKQRRTVMMHSKSKAGIRKVSRVPTNNLQVGLKLIDIFITTTGLAKKLLVSKGKHDRVNYLVPTEEAEEWLHKADEYCALLSPVYLPMLAVPKPWTGLYDGGYYTLVKSKRRLMKTWNNNYLEELSHTDLKQVLKAVNALQETPWRINKGVLKVLKELWQGGGRVAGLPPMESLELPPMPCLGDDAAVTQFKAEHPDEWLQWKRECSEVYNMNAKLQSKRVAVAQKLWIAQKFVNEDRIYFPHELDWRGRAYSAVAFVNPQGDDSGKALLEFADGVPLGEEGAKWLAIHGANCYGVDKVSFRDRIAWVDAHREAILDSAFNPLDGERFWMDADAPFQFLAFCFDWAGFLMEGVEHVSHLPVGLDGSCNGIQNFSAMLRDEVGGRAVNLLPSDKPADIYSEVAAVASAIVDEDAASGNPEAQLWKGKVTRKIAKRNTMTVPYGVSKYGMKGQLVDELSGMLLEGVDYLGVKNLYPAAQYMAGVNHTAIGKVVVAARLAMDWLQEVAKVAASNGLPVYWKTPMGLTVYQGYRTTTVKRHQLWFQGKTLNIHLREETEVIDKGRQQAGISPNFVHSMDAAHMMSTVNLCVDEGLTAFAMVHDSYGTHAANAGILAALLREAFIQQYTPDILEDFRNQLIEQLPEELHAKLPPVPPKGTLDLELVRDSEYFFA